MPQEEFWHKMLATVQLKKLIQDVVKKPNIDVLMVHADPMSEIAQLFQVALLIYHIDVQQVFALLMNKLVVKKNLLLVLWRLKEDVKMVSVEKHVQLLMVAHLRNHYIVQMVIVEEIWEIVQENPFAQEVYHLDVLIMFAQIISVNVQDHLNLLLLNLFN